MQRALPMRDCRIMRTSKTTPCLGAFHILESVLCLSCVLLSAQTAEATQVHTASEGLYVHQIAHLFFLFSMGILVYWLRQRSLVQETGWRFVQYAAFLFMLWNADAFIAHYLDGRGSVFETINAGHWNGWVDLGEDPEGLAVLYYLAKMDHLLSVPAILCLYLGLRELLRRAGASRPTEPEP